MCFCIFPYIGNVIIQTDELIFFRGVGGNHQPARLLKEAIPPGLYGIIIVHNSGMVEPIIIPYNSGMVEPILL